MGMKIKLLPVPAEILDELDVTESTVLEFYIDNQRLIISKVEEDRYICDQDCQNCPFMK